MSRAGSGGRDGLPSVAGSARAAMVSTTAVAAPAEARGVTGAAVVSRRPPGVTSAMRRSWGWCGVGPAVATVLLWAGLAGASAGSVAEPAVVYLSDLAREQALTCRQGWGRLGLDTAAVPPDGRQATPIRIGEKTYAKGLGHHASGEITVPIKPHYVRFCAEVGVQWQGGRRASTVLQVWVDGTKRFDSGVRNDSDPALPVDVAVAGARELRLVASDNGDGIGCDMATWAEARFLQDPSVPSFAPAAFLVGGKEIPRSDSAAGFSVALAGAGPQAAFLEPERAVIVCVGPTEEAALRVPLEYGKALTLRASVCRVQGGQAEVALTCGSARTAATLADAAPARLELAVPALPARAAIALVTRAGDAESAVRWQELTITREDGSTWRVPLLPAAKAAGSPAMVSALRPALEQQLIEWDWRLQDGIGTPRQPATWQTAVSRTLERGLRQADLLRRQGREVAPRVAQAEALQAEQTRLSASKGTETATWEDLWRRTHRWRRDLLLGGAWNDAGPIAFVKQVPSVFSHQLTQYYGACALPGGGLCVLDRPGQSLACRVLAPGALPVGSYQHLDVSADGQRLLFAYCHAETVPKDRAAHPERVYHLFEMGVADSAPRQLTAGPYDDFCPRYLPDGRLIFLSTRRGGFHRCGRGPCPVYTLALAEADGSHPHPISFHETNEWDPAVMADGRVVYTRWDYVDRSAVYYQQLWSVRPDGSDVRVLFGNNTYNPVGIWEARPIPGSRCLMATAAAHHAMTAGSIIRLDPTVGVDGAEPITRLTPDALFPESEAPVAPTGWHGALGVPKPPPVPEEQQRWPGHCYRSPYPLSETLFLAAYSYEALIGEPAANRANMFGLYLVDAFGNKELLHRDPNISSLWPMLLRARPVAPRLPSLADTPAGTTEPAPAEGQAATGGREGLFMLANAYAANPPLPTEVRLQRLRILQVLPKSTPHANQPPVGAANASPGKQVLGTVPVEADGSAFFRAPAGVALAFQVLDERGQAVQTMRSVTYLQPGETTGCIGCHEPRLQAPPSRTKPLAMARPASAIEPGPDGSNPLSYPLLVQPVLDQHCSRCHAGAKPKGEVALTAEPEGPYTKSYNALVKRVPFSAWGNSSFYPNNAEPLTRPDLFGARASPLMKKLLAGHQGVKLAEADVARLATWMDANALFYGTFSPADQARQRTGEHIAGPDIQ